MLLSSDSLVQRQEADLRAYRIIESLLAVAQSLAGQEAKPPDPGALFPSLRTLTLEGDAEEDDADILLMQTRAMFEGLGRPVQYTAPSPSVRPPPATH